MWSEGITRRVCRVGLLFAGSAKAFNPAAANGAGLLEDNLRGWCGPEELLHGAEVGRAPAMLRDGLLVVVACELTSGVVAETS